MKTHWCVRSVLLSGVRKVRFRVHKCQGRIYVDCDGYYDYEETVEALKKVFGIVGICPVVRTEVKEFEELKKDIVAYVGKRIRIRT